MTGAIVPKGMVVVVLAAVAWTSCASPQTAGGPNAECFRIEDCQEGLVCIERKCSRNLMLIEGEVPMGMAGQQGAGGAAPGDGASDAPSSPGEGGPAGGAPANGGAPASGGAPANGGAPPATGGAPPATGGSAPSNGGTAPTDAGPG